VILGDIIFEVAIPVIACLQYFMIQNNPATLIGVIATSAVGFVITVMDIVSMYQNDKHQMNRIATHADLKKEDTQKLVRQASGSFNDKIRAGMTEVITI
jgi:hypothetical protein